MCPHTHTNISTRSQVHHFSLVRLRPDQAALIREGETNTYTHYTHTHTSTRSRSHYFIFFIFFRPRPDQATLIGERETHTQAHTHTCTYQEPGALFDARVRGTVVERETHACTNAHTHTLTHTHTHTHTRSRGQHFIQVFVG